MSVWEILLVGASLAMDAFAVAMCKGVEMKKFIWKYALLIAAFFGFFQMLMPVIGWALASQFEQYITQYDHWIAFGLLFILGAKMIADAFKKDKPLQEGEEEKPLVLGFKTLVVMAVATSIDALAVGVTFAFLAVNIWIAIAIIGSVTFALSMLGVFIGTKAGEKFKHKAEFAGGVVLIGLGIKILVEHLIG